MFAKFDGALLALVCTAILFMSGCRKAAEFAPPAGFDFQVAPRPPHVGSVTLTLSLANTGARPVIGAQVMMEGNMTHPGMSPIFGEAREIGLGVYQAHLDFKMAGDWVVLAHIRLANGRKLEYQLGLPGIRPN